MSIAQSLLPEFDLEMAGTRRLLELVPDSDASWRPHPKSYTLGELATHLSILPLWGRLTVELSELDLGAPANADIARAPFATTREVLDRFDRNVREARAALAAASDSAMGASWSLRNGARTVFTLARAAVLRSFVLNHMIHHRGQLTVYLRLRDVPLPSTYGPTADSR
ncbi:MAG TPA: DinB family protein [Gemmatimonadales bacterium]|nr:DinB family protein [Gemmatimonadales bacterium]